MANCFAKGFGLTSLGFRIKGARENMIVATEQPLLLRQFKLAPSRVHFYRLIRKNNWWSLILAIVQCLS